jgi:hypothetical protein
LSINEKSSKRDIHGGKTFVILSIAKNLQKAMFTAERYAGYFSCAEDPSLSLRMTKERKSLKKPYSR